MLNENNTLKINNIASSYSLLFEITSWTYWRIPWRLSTYQVIFHNYLWHHSLPLVDDMDLGTEVSILCFVTCWARFISCSLVGWELRKLVLCMRDMCHEITFFSTKQTKNYTMATSAEPSPAQVKYIRRLRAFLDLLWPCKSSYWVEPDKCKIMVHQ